MHQKKQSSFKSQLRPGVNFINVKRAHFSYERLFSSYVLALNELSYEKFARLTLMKLTADRGVGVTAELFAFPKILIQRDEEIQAWQSLIEDDLIKKMIKKID